MPTVKLNNDLLISLLTLHNSGNGYFFVDVYLKNGNILKNKVIYNDIFLETEDDISIDDILSIKSHTK